MHNYLFKYPYILLLAGYAKVEYRIVHNDIPQDGRQADIR